MDVRKISLRGAIVFASVCAIVAPWAVVRAQSPSQTTPSKSAPDVAKYSPSKLDVPARAATAGYPYSPYLDAEIADPDVHRVLYADDRVMLLEVSNPPGFDVHMHGHPYATVSGNDTAPGGGNPQAAQPAAAAGNANNLL